MHMLARQRPEVMLLASLLIFALILGWRNLSGSAARAGGR